MSDPWPACERCKKQECRMGLYAEPCRENVLTGECHPIPTLLARIERWITGRPLRHEPNDDPALAPLTKEAPDDHA